MEVCNIKSQSLSMSIDTGRSEAVPLQAFSTPVLQKDVGEEIDLLLRYDEVCSNK
jgi:hypothetical protein